MSHPAPVRRRMTLRQTASFAWRTLRSMRTRARAAPARGARLGDRVADPADPELARARSPSTSWSTAGSAGSTCAPACSTCSGRGGSTCCWACSSSRSSRACSRARGHTCGRSANGPCRRASSTRSPCTGRSTSRRRRRTRRPPRAGSSAGAATAWPPTGRPSPPRRAPCARSGAWSSTGRSSILLLGAVIGKGTGYSGRATIVEQETWTDAAINYDPLSLRTGRYFDGELQRPRDPARRLRRRLRRRPGSRPASNRRWTCSIPTGAVTGTAVVSRERAVRLGDLRIHQFGFGWAPVVTVTDRGESVFDGPIVMTPGDRARRTSPSSRRPGTAS